MRFIESLDEVPEGETVLFSAHGVAPRVREQAVARSLKVIDATCPFVARAHRQVREFAEHGVPVVIVGDVLHVEVVGLVGEYKETGGDGDGSDGRNIQVVKDAADVAALPFPADVPVGVVCQTTLSSGAVTRVLSALRARYPRLIEPSAAETCTATRDRQRAVGDFVRGSDPSVTGVLVVGSANSSNTARLVEIAREAGAVAWRLDGPKDLPECDFAGIKRLGLTAGASTPESVVAEIVFAFDGKGGDVL